MQSWRATHEPLMWGLASRAPLLLSVGLAAACEGSDISGDPVAGEADIVDIMTYNIFHDGESPDRGIEAWPERRDAIVEIIRGQWPDVLGLQEAEVWQVDWLLDRLPEYAAVARGPYEDPDVAEAETVAILYREGRFHLEESGHFWYSDSPDSPGSYGSAEFGGMSRPRMATWVRLRREGSTSAAGALYVFNTHFVPDGTADDPDLARSRSAELLVRRIAERAHANEPFAVIGDLNLTPDEWPLRYLLGNRCESGSDCPEPSSGPQLRMTDAWAALNPGGGDAGTRCNGITGSDGPRVDYVLVYHPTPVAGSCDLGPGPCEPPEVLDADIVASGSGCPSDHRPVVATIAFPRGR